MTCTEFKHGYAPPPPPPHREGHLAALDYARYVLKREQLNVVKNKRLINLAQQYIANTSPTGH